MLTPCDGCANWDWCKRRGCTTWNDESRHQYERLKRRSAESNAEIDDLERILAEQGDVWR
jgi:outer membrane protease